MALDLDNRPGQVYDPEKTGDDSVPQKKDVDKGISDLENYANSPSDDDIERGIGDLERHANSNDGQDSAVNSGEGGLYRPSTSGKRGKNKTTKISGKFTKRQKIIGGGVAGVSITGIIAASILSTGPLQILQFANLLERFHLTGNSSLTEGRLGNFYKYLKYPDSPQNRRIGAIARRSTAKVEANFKARGLDPVWDTKGRLTRFDVNPADLPALRSAGLGPNIVETNGSYRIIIDPPGTSAKDARAALRNVTDVIQSLDVKVGAIGMRNLRTKAGVGFFDSSVRRLGQNVDATLQEKSDRYKEFRTKEVESDPLKGNIDTNQETTNADGETETTKADATTIDGKAGASSKIDSIKSGATKGVAVVGIACAAYKIAESADDLRQSNVIQPLMRFGMRTLTVASQIQMGGSAVDLEALGFLVRDMYDASAPVGAQSWREAAPVQANLGETITGPSIPNSAHPTNGGNFILQAFQAVEAFGGKAIDAVCGAVSSVAGQIVGYALNFTPIGFAVDVATDQLVNVLFNEYGDDLVALLAGKAIDTAEFVGGTFGAAADFGVMLSGNESMLSLGGRVLSGGEVSELNQYYAELRQEEMKDTNVFERYFAINNPESLVAQSVTTTAQLSNPQRVLNNISTAKYAKSLSSTFSSLFVNKAYAQTSASFSYDVDQIGFSLDEIDNPDYQDPFANERAVEPIIQGYKDKINKCFGLDLQSDNSLLPIEDAIRIVGSERDSSCNDTSEEWTRIRFFILDQNVASSFDCNETSDTKSCQVAGVSTVPSASATGGSAATNLSAPGLNGYAVPCQGLPTPVVRLSGPRADWTNIKDSGVIGKASDGTDIKVYIREACPGATDVKTIFIASSVHGTENGGQLVSHELLFNEDLPDNIRIIAVPEINPAGIFGRSARGRVNANGVNLNRNFDYNWSGLPANRGDNYNDRGPSAGSEPETQALVNFVNNLGKIDLSFHYHDNIHYVAAVESLTPVELARIYASQSPTTPLRPAENGRVYQAGSFDGWMTQTKKIPSLLVEMSQDQEPNTITQHVAGAKAVIESGGY